MPRSLPFQIATFAAAFLLFLVQPILAKQILPWFGGAPAVWTASLLFFQLGLTAGYLYAHVLGRVDIKWQAGVHVVLLLAATAALPIIVSLQWQPVVATDATASPAWRVVLALAATAGLPYVLLSATAPLLQSWWRVTSQKEPYQLYALSNAGSLAALMAFPTLVEPFLTVQRQAALWTAGYATFVVTCGITASAVGAVASTRERVSTEVIPRPAAGDYAIWILLSGCGSGLLSATTNQLCQDVAVVPLLWLLPLAVYLLTFILTFGGVFSRTASRTLLGTGALAALFVTAFAQSVPLVWQVAAFLALLGGACMVCHGELVQSRPAGSRLTGFYLAMSAGGALGGASVALLAPRVFTSFAELPVLVILAMMVAAVPPSRTAKEQRHRGAGLVLLWSIPAIALGLSIRFLPSPESTKVRLIDARRDFFGVLRVLDQDIGQSQASRALYYGRVLHGLQMREPGSRRTATTYFGAGSGISLAFEQHPRRVAGQPLRAAVVGLGAGTIAAWGRAGDEIVFYELNPTVLDLAQRHFTFLEDSSARTQVVLGDARLSLEREMSNTANRGTYDLIAVDAFSGDAVPTHLLTRECFNVYLRALAPSGVLAIHISNFHVDLRPPVRGLAAEAGLSAVEMTTSHPKGFDRVSDWVILSTDSAFLRRATERGAVHLGDQPQVVWTDHYNSIVRLLR